MKVLVLCCAPFLTPNCCAVLLTLNWNSQVNLHFQIFAFFKFKELQRISLSNIPNAQIKVLFLLFHLAFTSNLQVLFRFLYVLRLYSTNDLHFINSILSHGLIKHSQFIDYMLFRIAFNNL